MVPGFQFNLGFSGKYFKNGNEEENAGDEELIKNAHKFRWFCHTWAHKQPHKVNTLDDMKSLVNLNMEFAKVKQNHQIIHVVTLEEKFHKLCISYCFLYHFVLFQYISFESLLNLLFCLTLYLSCKIFITFSKKKRQV